MRYNAGMQVISLQSGSNGNCIYVEADGVPTAIRRRDPRPESRAAGLSRPGCDAVDAVVISHDHADHCRSMGILHRTFGLPIHATAKTHEAAGRYTLGEIADLRHFVAGATVWFGKVRSKRSPRPTTARMESSSWSTTAIAVWES